ncbi:unnamed protein product [Arctogadus glacialis]
MTNTQRRYMMGLFVVLMLIYSTEAYLNDPAVCYMLDGILIFYCIIVTALFFNIKDLQSEGGNVGQPVIELQGIKQSRKKKKRQVDGSNRISTMDAYESLASSSAAPQLHHR